MSRFRFSVPLMGVLPALLLAVVTVAWFLLCTGSGLQTVFALVQRYGGAHLSIGSAQGKLLGECLLSDVHYAAADGLQVDIQRLHLRLQPGVLLARRLHIPLAEVSGLVLKLPPPDHTPPLPLTQLPDHLPLDVVIDTFELKDFRILRGDAELLEISHADLTASWIGNQLRIAHLNADLPQTGALMVSGQAQMSPDHVDVKALSVQGPGQLGISGRFGIGTVASDLDVRWQGLRWPLTANGAALIVSGANGSARISGVIDDYSLVLDSNALVRKLPVRLTLHGSGNTHDLRISELALGAEKGALHAQGTLGWSPELSADLRMQIEHLDPALFAAQWSGELNGTAAVHSVAHTATPQFAFSANLGHSSLRGLPLTLAVDGSTDERSVQFRQFLLRSGKGSLDARGTLAWSPALRADVQANIANFDPGPFVPLFSGDSGKDAATRWHGLINGRIDARTTMRAGNPDTAFSVSVDHSNLRGYPLLLAAQGELLGDILNLRRFTLNSGDTGLSASGQVTPPFDLAGKLSSPDLAALLPGLAGRADFDFRLQGPLAAPHLLTHGSASGLRYRGSSAAKLAWSADLDPRQPSQLALELSGANAGGVAIHSVKLSAGGVEVYQHVQLDVTTERGDLSLSADGGYDRKRQEWGGNLMALRVAPADLPAWMLEKPIGVLLGRRRQSVEPACFSGDGGRVCLRLEQNVTRAGLRLSWNLERLLLASFKPLLPPKTDIDGEANGSGSIEIANGDVAAANAMLNLGTAHFGIGKLPPLEILPSSLKIDNAANRLHATLDLRTRQGTLTADVAAAPAADFTARALSGSAQINLPDLAFVASLLPALQSTAGNVTGTLDFGGSIGLPHIGGQLALNNGRARLAVAGITLENLQLQLTGDGSGPLMLAGSMTSGGGTVNLSGSLDPTTVPLHADLSIKGDNFEVMATPDAHIWAAPDLHLLNDAGGIHLDGGIVVPKADITPQNFGDSGVSASRDQIIVGAQPQPPASPLNIHSQLQLTLGDAVHVEGFGLTTRMTGAVTLSDEPQHETRAQGELQLVDGHYKAYGQDLKIQTGRLIFTGGPVTQPAVDLYATRHPQQDITVGVRVRGTLDKPQLSLQSDPAMPREQQLSWLVLGRSLDQSSSADQNMMSQAALSLGLSGGDYLAQKLGQGIGLDQISVGQAPVTNSSVAADATSISGSRAAQNVGANAYTTQAAQLTLGKYLTPKLFVSYGVSLFQPGQTFRMLYDIGHGWQLQTESGVASGGDLVYTYEH
ncbi:MAG: translocation/assembly module TamB domain-containing protein [Stenotrophobium sp.]